MLKSNVLMDKKVPRSFEHSLRCIYRVVILFLVSRLEHEAEREGEGIKWTDVRANSGPCC